jgi:small-conductance mechanosensitive channel
MNLSNVLVFLQRLLDSELFSVANTTITLATALSTILIALATIWLSHIFRRGSRRLLQSRGVKNESTIGTVNAVLHYLMLALGFGVILQTLGIDLGALFAAGAIFAIGIGFAMQNIVENFVAGVILLSERTIRPGDVLEVESEIVRVSRMGIRATIVRARDGEDLIVPNAVLVQSTVKNYTLHDAWYRLQTSVGVVYHADMQRVRQTLERVVEQIEWRLDEPAPQVYLKSFGDNAVIYDVALWMTDPWAARKALSELNEAIWWALKEQDITIAFPQLDLHLDPDVTRALKRLSGLSRS